MKSKPTYQELEKENEILHQELKISKRDKKFDSYFDFNKSIMLQIHSDTKQIIRANNAAINFYGYSKKELLQKTINDLNTLPLEEINSLMQKAVKNKSNFFVFQHKLSNGEIKNVEVYASPFKSDNETYIILTIIEVTALKKAEQALLESESKFRTIFKESKSVQLLINLETKKIVDANQTACDFYGYTHQVLTSMKISDINQLSEKETGARMITTKEKLFKHFEFEHKLSNGVIKDVEVYSNLVIINNEKLLFSIIHDVTNRKLAEQDLKQSEQKLRESNRSKDKFFSIIAHDLKSPFNAILGFSEILLEKHKEYDDEKREKLIESVYNSANGAFKLLENLLTWSRSHAGAIKYLPEELHLKIVLFETILNLQGQADKKNIIVLDEISENELIFADKNMIITVLRNLISNAIKFTNKGGSIIISSEKQTDSDFIKISVEDTGIGIPKDKIDDLFSIDKNTSTKGTENEKGTGLGLILCKEFVEKHNGKIWVESEDGKGSIFIFTMPNIHK